MKHFVDNHNLNEYINDVVEIVNPDQVVICDGSESEYKNLCTKLVNSGTFIALDKDKWPNCYACNSDPSDVARVEDRTFICTTNKDDVGPTNNWEDPAKMKHQLSALLKDSMTGRTMYIIPFCMGPIGSSFSKYGIQITDSPYVVVNMHITTRVHPTVLKKINEGYEFVKCLHSLGAPLLDKQVDKKWPCNPTVKYICHFPETNEIISYGSGYGGNALLGKKCFGLRISSYMAYKQGWLSEHMLIMGIENPQGEKKYFAAAFPSACGKTNFSMLIPPKELDGWKITTVGDDIAWIKLGSDGVFYAVNPENGFFGVAPGTNESTNPNAIATLSANTIFTNVGVTPDGDVWWEGLTKQPPSIVYNWKGELHDTNSDQKIAHPNARFSSPAIQCPSIDPNWESFEGVPISAFIFGGRRSASIPLILESFNWNHGVYNAATMASETTAAAFGEQGVVRRDPFAMLPFCGYNMANYFKHWIGFGERKIKLPKIYNVNWFRKDSGGKYIWPGFSENMRILKWIFQRINGKANALNTSIGYMPSYEDIDWGTTNFNKDDFNSIMSINKDEWLNELNLHLELFKKYNNQIPDEFYDINFNLQKSMKAD